MKILFQGDSITDSDRLRNDDISLGQGYAVMLAGRLGFDYPGKHEFINRAIYGDKLDNMYSRWKTDCLDIKPDIISILIGVNDIWSRLASPDEIDHQYFENLYSKLLLETIGQLPKTKIILLEPFVLPGQGSGAINLELFQKELGVTQDIVAGLARKYSLKFIPLQEAFTSAATKADPSYWLCDGVHPTAAGHAVIADNCISVFRESVCN